MRRLLVALLSLASSLPARAWAGDKLDETLDVEVTQGATWLETDSLTLAPAITADPPPSLTRATPRLEGAGVASLTRGRLLLSLEGVRFGAGVGFLAASGPSLHHTELPDGVLMEGGLLWGVPLEAFVAYAFGPAREVRPYLEVRGGLTVLQARLRASHPGQGDLGGGDFAALLPSVGGRSGALVPLSEYFFLDLGVGYGFVGPERLSLFVGLGLPIPLANL